MIPGLLRSIWLATLCVVACLEALPTQAATYYISPIGSDTNPGTSVKPWLTFSYALDPSRTLCGDTLVLKNGTYGDETSTGKISLIGRMCTPGNELIIKAENERQAKIFDNGTGIAIQLKNSAYITLDGLYARSQDNLGGSVGKLFHIETSQHITVRRSIAVNPNRYNNAHTFTAYRSQHVLFEMNESYIFGRHCVSAGESSNVTVRLQYCNPRGGKIAGGFSAGGMPIGSGDAVFSMYPCRDCILENSIADGTESPMFLNEQNATFASNTLMSGAQVLGSICYKCGAGNGIYPNGRKIAALSHSPQDLLIRDVAIVNYTSPSSAIKCQDCVNATLDHITVLADPTMPGVTGIQALDSAYGGSASENSIFITNVLVAGVRGRGVSLEGHATWSGDGVWSHGNGASIFPPLPSNWKNTSTTAHGMGTCKVWIPDGAAVKGAGTGGSDIGANILYRYVNGVLTSTPLWNPVTGEFPYGAPDLDRTNRVAGRSLFDIHIRLNVNTGGCFFPKSYGNSDSDRKSPIAPASLTAS